MHLNNNNYLDEWSMDRGKEHWKLAGKLINYANRLASPQDFLCMPVIHLRSVGLLTATNATLFYLVYFMKGKMFWFSGSGLATCSSEILVMPECKKKSKITAQRSFWLLPST